MQHLLHSQTPAELTPSRDLLKSLPQYSHLTNLFASITAEMLFLQVLYRQHIFTRFTSAIQAAEYNFHESQASSLEYKKNKKKIVGLEIWYVMFMVKVFFSL